jgi:hypothetical protein
VTAKCVTPLPLACDHGLQGHQPECAAGGMKGTNEVLGVAESVCPSSALTPPPDAAEKRWLPLKPLHKEKNHVDSHQ